MVVTRLKTLSLTHIPYILTALWQHNLCWPHAVQTGIIGAWGKLPICEKEMLLNHSAQKLAFTCPACFMGFKGKKQWIMGHGRMSFAPQQVGALLYLYLSEGCQKKQLITKPVLYFVQKLYCKEHCTYKMYCGPLCSPLFAYTLERCIWIDFEILTSWQHQQQIKKL